MYMGKKGNTELSLGYMVSGMVWYMESVVVSLCQKLKNMHCYVFFDSFFTSPKLLIKLSEMVIYATGTVRANRKHMPELFLATYCVQYLHAMLFLRNTLLYSLLKPLKPQTV